MMSDETFFFREYFCLDATFVNTDHIFLFLTPPTDSKAGILVPLGRNLSDYFHLKLLGFPLKWKLFLSEGCESQQSEKGIAPKCPNGFAVR